MGQGLWPKEGKELVEVFVDKYSIDLGDKSLQKPYTGQLDKLHGLSVGSLCILKHKNDPEHYIIINANNEKIGSLKTISKPCSVYDMRRQLINSYQGDSEFGEWVLIEDKISPTTWAGYVDKRTPYVRTEQASSGVLTVNNLGFKIFLFSPNEKLKDLCRHIDNVIQGKQDHAVSFQPERVKILQAKWKAEAAEEKARLLKQSQERDSQGFPAYGNYICENVDMQASYLCKEAGMVYATKKLNPISEIQNLLSLNDLKLIWKKNIYQQEENTQGVFVRLGDREKCIFILVMRFATKEEAKARLVQYRYVNPKDISQTISFLSEKNVKAQTKVNPRLVGEFDLSLKHQFDASGSIIPKSNESALYFQRGETAVMVVSQDPKASVLELAKQIDQVLIKRMNSQ